MEERVEIMTDNQWFGMIKMLLALAKRCDSKEDIIRELENFLRDKDKEKTTPEG